MYSKVVYDYFNSSNPEKFKCKPNKLVRKNAFKKKATKKTVVVPKKSNTSIKAAKSSSPIKDASQEATQSTENRSTVNIVYDTVQCIWKYAKSFISNPNLEASKFQDRSRKTIKCRSSNRNIKLKSLRSTVPYDTLPKHVSNEKEKSCELVKTTNKEISIENFPQEIEDATIEEVNQNDETVDEDFLTIETPTNFQELKAQLIEDKNIEDPEKHSICEELNLCLLDTNNETFTSTNCDHIASKETQNIEPDEEDAALQTSFKKNQKKITEVYIKQQDLQNNNQGGSENVNVEVQILKSSIKTYGRGKRRNKKLHVHFNDEYDNEQRKYSTFTIQKLRKSDCYHPNAFYKKFKIKPMPERKKSTHSICGKKRRMALCTKSFSKKKRSTRNSSSNISLQTKSSESNVNITGKKTRKTPKKYPVYRTTKIYKRKRAKNYKKVIANEKDIKKVQDIIKTIADAKYDEPVNISHNDAYEVLKAINIGDELCTSQQLTYLQQTVATEDDNLSRRNQDNLSEELNEFVEFINNE